MIQNSEPDQCDARTSITEPPLFGAALTSWSPAADSGQIGSAPAQNLPFWALKELFINENLCGSYGLYGINCSEIMIQEQGFRYCFAYIKDTVLPEPAQTNIKIGSYAALKSRLHNTRTKGPDSWSATRISDPDMHLFCLQKRAVDPDPHGSAFILLPGSGSRRENFSNKNRKKARKLLITAILFNF